MTTRLLGCRSSGHVWELLDGGRRSSGRRLRVAPGWEDVRAGRWEQSNGLRDGSWMIEQQRKTSAGADSAVRPCAGWQPRRQRVDGGKDDQTQNSDGRT
ncbi:hypothetical protein GUJ93_ZPchr0002g24479 [Zizania palustris]|uniref:Uncharacterized protein n=1 Tax=Zizania palustris TaxID=103762 RepID=A0A8J5VWU4_ZIZPA|nr:hypothetical protein GUJ93_ZPchr0002g24479 [Zizania palustris]